MIVFKAYLLIIRKNAGLLLMYLGIVVALAIMMTLLNRQQAATDFANTRVNIALFNDDSNGDGSANDGASADPWLAENLTSFLAGKATLVAIPDDPQQIKDALYFEKIVYVLRIPQGFTARFLADDPLPLQQLSAPNSTSALYLDMMVDKYLNTLAAFRAGLPEAQTAEIVQLTADNLAIETPVEMKATQVRRGTYDNIVYYYNYLSYALLSILILGVSTCMLTFNNLDLRRRNFCSPLTLRSLSLQLLAGNLAFSLLSWLLLILVSLVLYPQAMFSPFGALFALNAFTFMLVSLTLSFLIGNALKSRNAQAAISNVVTLGSSFIAGVFVPQALLGQTVLAIARFTPTYWYVRANTEIGALENPALAGTLAIWQSIGIQLGFAAAFLIASYTLIRIKRQWAN